MHFQGRFDLMNSLPTGFDSHVQTMVELAQGIEGYLTPREARFLCLLAVVATTSGDVLEIGSYKGKSTVVLAKSVRFAGGDGIVAVDPLSLPSSTDPNMRDKCALPEQFRKTLVEHDVDSIVEFHQMCSHELGRMWDRPLRLLWIDGDHTYPGAKADFQTFRRFLNPGAIVAFHDVLHGFDGPVRVFCDELLFSNQFGACGVCGSIGWSQYLGDEPATRPYWNWKLRLHAKLSRLIPYAAGQGQPKRLRARIYKLKRSLVPHGDVQPDRWINEVRIMDSSRF